MRKRDEMSAGGSVKLTARLTGNGFDDPDRAWFPSTPCESELPLRQNIDMSHGMEKLFGDPAYKGFVLQDHKRLPSRFFARVSGALTSQLA